MEAEEVRLSDDDNLSTWSCLAGQAAEKRAFFWAPLPTDSERRWIHLHRRQGEPEDHRSGLLPIEARHEGIAFPHL